MHGKDILPSCLPVIFQEARQKAGKTEKFGVQTANIKVYYKTAPPCLTARQTQTGAFAEETCNSVAMRKQFILSL